MVHENIPGVFRVGALHKPCSPYDFIPQSSQAIGSPEQHHKSTETQPTNPFSRVLKKVASIVVSLAYPMMLDAV
jgi:hypothetical protein